MEQQFTPEQQELISSVSGQVEQSLESCRQQVGELVSKLGNENEHPLGVALALAMAATTVIASVGVATDMPVAATKQLMQSLMEEAQKVGLESYSGMTALKAAGISPQEVAEIRAKNAAKQAAND